MPLFPLNTVLFPGLTLPLHIFEERYRQLVRELVETSGPRRFGVVAIRHGLEVGEEPELYDVGCVAELRRVQPYADGRFDIVTIGGPRFRVTATDDSRPYLQGSVDYLPDPMGDRAETLAPVVGTEFHAYWELVAQVREESVEVPPLPEDAQALSYLVAAALVTDLPEKQELLTIPDTASRLRRELSLLRRETALLRRMVEAPPLTETEGPFSLN